MSRSAKKNQKTTADLFDAKKKRRCELAAKSVEEKFEILIELQKMTSKIAEEAGRESRKPWDVKVHKST